MGKGQRSMVKFKLCKGGGLEFRILIKLCSKSQVRVRIREKMSIRKKIRKFRGAACLPKVSNCSAENVNKCYFPIFDFLFTWRV